MVERRTSGLSARIVLSCGLSWGLAEATLGHFLHWLPVPGLAGAVMFPVGLFFMNRAAGSIRASVRKGFSLRLPVSAVPFLVSAAASAVKSIDAFLPGRGLIMAVRPSLAILAEGLLVSLALAAAGLVHRARFAHLPS